MKCQILFSGNIVENISNLSPLETICMKCQVLFSGKIVKNISKCHVLKILPRVLSIKSVFRRYSFVCLCQKLTVGTHWNYLSEAIPISTHKICFFFQKQQKLSKIITR